MASTRLWMARAAARAGLWPSVIRLLGSAPFEAGDAESLGLLSYAYMMLGDQPFTRAHLERLMAIRRGMEPEAQLWVAQIARRAGNATAAGAIYKDLDSRSALPEVRPLHEFCLGFLNGEIRSEISQSVDKLGLRPAEPLIITAAGSNALPLYHLWRHLATKNATQRRVVLALEFSAWEAAIAAGDACVDLSKWIAFDSPAEINLHTRQSLWTLRVLVFLELLRRGHQVASVDLDALILSSLDQMLARMPAADIVAQRDFSLPMDVARKLGWVVCCGFFVAQPTPAAIAFAERWLQRTFREGDDQMAANHLIAENGVPKVQDTDDAQQFEACGVLWAMPSRELVSRSLDSGSVVRHFTRHGEDLAEIRQRLGVAAAPAFER